MKHNLDYWKEWASRNETALGDQALRMDRREQLYRGEIREIEPLTARDTQRSGLKIQASHLWNIVAENIESEVSSTIPQPKVTARRKEDERRAKILEDMLRNELDRLPMEELNDLLERMIPIQGGAYWLVEWDASRKTNDTNGDVTVSVLHPKQVIPQDGVFTRVEDMDAIAIKLPQTKAYIKRAYGKDVEDETEDSPEARTIIDDTATADDMVTQWVVYYRNDKGGVGKISWVGDTVLEEMEDYEARKVRRCAQCGERLAPGTEKCPVCGATNAKEGMEDTEDIYQGFSTQMGTQIPGAQIGMDQMGLPEARPTTLPYYRPDVFPIFLQRNVSVFGQLLGDSDVDKIEDQQNTLARMETKIIDRFIKAGTRITLPDRADFRVDPEDGEKWYLSDPAAKSMIGVYQFSGDLSQEMTYQNQVYEEARKILGITDSFQGRKDTTAQSGVAKQFAAQQSAGRLESKRVLKEAAYAELFKRIVQLKVAYADEPRPIVAEDNRGGAQYEEFNRYDFYEQDNTGAWHCILDDDRFLFSCDAAGTLAANRPQMWQETTAMLQMGAFGNPQDPQTLLLYWTKMELLHYPGASDTKEYLEELQAQAQQQQMEMQAQQAAMQQAQMQAQQQREDQIAAQQRQDAEQQAMRDADRQAREDAWRTVQAMAGRQQAGPVPVPQQ